MTRQVDEAIKGRIKELRTDVWYSKKGHYNAAAIWNVIHYVLGSLAAISAAYIGVRNVDLSETSIIVFSVASAVFGALITFLKPQDKASQHKLAGDNFDDLLQKLTNLNDVDLLQGSDADHTARLKELSAAKTNLNKASLPIPRIAYQRSKKGISDGEASYTEDI